MWPTSWCCCLRATAVPSQAPGCWCWAWRSRRTAGPAQHPRGGHRRRLRDYRRRGGGLRPVGGCAEAAAEYGLELTGTGRRAGRWVGRSQCWPWRTSSSSSWASRCGRGWCRAAWSTTSKGLGRRSLWTAGFDSCLSGHPTHSVAARYDVAKPSRFVCIARQYAASDRMRSTASNSPRLPMPALPMASPAPRSAGHAHPATGPAPGYRPMPRPRPGSAGASSARGTTRPNPGRRWCGADGWHRAPGGRQQARQPATAGAAVLHSSGEMRAARSSTPWLVKDPPSSAASPPDPSRPGC